ncbi:hypothetical protein FQ707_01505 [Bacteroidaceae bacterium HV4-6-C5C]|nr:hypothetical protein FQ707_01505 [Bacteroidaceae bacterium HV4-6-C5C]
MKQQITIPDITSYILRKCNTVNSIGLYNGKAGLSLSLFVASEYMQDQKVEDIAYDLIKESLVINQSDLSFEGGLAGVGYALLYLIENKYLDADFDEIFGEQYEKIIESFEKIEQNPIRLINSLKEIYFLFRAGRIKRDERAQLIIKKICEGVELFFTIQFHDFIDIHFSSKKIHILNIYSLYLKLIDYIDYAHFSRSLLENYASLYRKEKVVSSLDIGYCLKLITEKYYIKGYDDVIHENISNGINNIYPCMLSLEEKINLIKYTYKNKPIEINASNSILDFKVISKDDTIEDLLEVIKKKDNPIGYGTGLARLLMFCVNKDIELV